MVTLTNPIDDDNIVLRFADYVRATANAGIVWGTNVKPFPEKPTTDFGGTTSGKAIQISAANLTNPISASNIYSTMFAELTRYTRIRKLRAQLNVTGAGNTVGAGSVASGSRPTPGIVYDQTQVAHMPAALQTTPAAIAVGQVTAGAVIDEPPLETLFNNMRTRYNTARAATVTQTTTVCHSSCHTNCHGSRGRR